MRVSSVMLVRRVHRHLGVFLSFFLFLLATTGIVLNHSEAIDLDDRFVPAWIAGFYLDAEAATGLLEADRIFYSVGGNLYADQTDLAACFELQGKTNFDGQEIFLCDGEVLLFTADLQLIERIDVSKGLPSNVDAVHSTGTQFLVRTGSNWQGFDLLTLSVMAQTASVAPVLADWAPVPSHLLLSEAVSWQQFVLDVHSGAIAGFSGKLFNDLVGVFVMLMALSGLLMWRN
jgi:hypothetical protein